MISKEYGWADKRILKLPYYRFCQIRETINRRIFREQKLELEIKEAIAKFETSIFALGSYLKKDGKQDLLDRINDFTIFKRDEKEKEEGKEVEKLPPVGSYEKIMNIFGGGK